MPKKLKFLLFGSLLIAMPRLAVSLEIQGMRFWTAPDQTRLVFDVSSDPAYDISMLANPNRLVVDFKNTRLRKSLQQPPVSHPLFSSVRSSARGARDFRVVIDLKTSISYRSFHLSPSHQYGDRLVIDMTPTVHVANVGAAPVIPSIAKTLTIDNRDVIIAIDAGHGGEDPGARGPLGTQEKKVVLQIARKLAALVDRQPGMKAVLVRKGDYYIKLRRRMDIARDARADLFVSIHADAFKNSKVKGASVFTLSRKGASSETARWLANHENATDMKLAGGVTLDDKDKDLASVLLDLSLNASKEVSRQVGSQVLNSIKKVGHLHQHMVQKAGFMVLKSPDIPSILVETAFISNPSEERKLRSSVHQQKMAKAIFDGIYGYFSVNAPAGTLLAALADGQGKHVIGPGETLSGIAKKYGVSLRAIKSANALVSSTIHIGQVLTIPAGS